MLGLMKSVGWQSSAAKDGLDALETLHRLPSRPDAILLDVEMPRMDGYELLATLKKQDVYKEIPVIMITSRAGEKHRQKALELGAADYIAKPYQDELLLDTIRKLAQ
jgi:CheY-like chemotaxis protein